MDLNPDMTVPPRRPDTYIIGQPFMLNSPSRVITSPVSYINNLPLDNGEAIFYPRRDAQFRRPTQRTAGL